jgi:hypothetical protein
MPHVLVFDSDCAACSRAAQAVARMGIAGLEVRGLSDPEVVARLGEAGLEPPKGPALLSGEGAQARLATGWAMRRGLARLMGWRRATAVARLISVERRARAERARSLSRRRVIGAGLAVAAGAVTSALLPEAAAAASPQAPAGLVPASDAETRRALGSAAVQAAVGTWGPAHPAGVTSDGTTSVLVFGFAGAQDVALLVDNTAGASADRMALAIRSHAANGGTLEFLSPDGTALGSVTVVAGKVVTTPAAPTIHIPTAKIRCFLHCLGAHLTAQCILTCHTCVTTPNPFSRIVACAHCVLCAGPEAIRCAVHCLK